MSYGGYGGYNSNNYNGGSRGYNPDPFADPGGSRDASAGHEMASFPQPSPKPILQQCSDIEREIDVIERSIMALASARKRYLDDPDTSGNSQSKRDVDVRRQQIMDQYRGLADRVRAMQSDPESQRWSARVKVAGDKLKNAIQKFQEQEAAFRMAEDKRMERQLRIVRPDVSDDEIREAVASGEGAIFQQAVMTNSRLAQAGGVLNAVKERHKEMQKIEQSLVELLQLLNDMQELLAKQEVTIMEIDTQAEQAAEHMEEANVQLDKAIVSAKKTRKWKWICLGICVAIVVIIVVAVVAYIMINRAANGGGGGGNNNNNNNNNSGSTNPKGNNGNNNNNSGSGTTGQKRNLFGRNVLDDLQMNTARAVAFTSEQPAARGYPVDTSSTEANAAAPAARSSRRRLNRVRGAAAAEKRFVVSWDPTDPTGP